MESKQKKSKEKVETKGYLVKTKGYKETFDSLDKAKGQLEILKKRAIKSQSNVKIQVFEKSKSGVNVVDEVQISKDFYED